MKETNESRELQLFIENDGDLYRQTYYPILKNYQKKIDKGNFDKVLAVKGFVNLANEGAKRYCIRYCSPDLKYFNVFSVADRKIVAENLTKYFINEVDCGNRFD